MKEVLEDPESGTPKDRMRLLLVYFLCHPSLSDQDVERLCGILEVSPRYLYLAKSSKSRYTTSKIQSCALGHKKLLFCSQVVRT